MFNLEDLLRDNIRELAPYSCARDEFTGEASIYLDANENPFDSGLNRYPDPYQQKIKERLSILKKIETDQIFIGNGSDEPIDLLFRAFCNPGKDNYVTIAPTYGMYRVSADINDIAAIQVNLEANFALNADKLLEASTPNSKLLFLCSPNNPTGNSLDPVEVQKIVDNFHGIVVIDEAYIDFSANTSYISTLKQNSNLVILQTLSKAWGLAGIRLGMAYASPEIIAILNKIKYPYNINTLTQKQALESLQDNIKIEKQVAYILAEREKLSKNLKQLPTVQKVYPSDTNFLLIEIAEASTVYNKLQQEGIIVRDRSRVVLCNNTLRITVGTTEENSTLLDALKQITE